MPRIYSLPEKSDCFLICLLVSRLRWRRCFYFPPICKTMFIAIIVFRGHCIWRSLIHKSETILNKDIFLPNIKFLRQQVEKIGLPFKRVYNPCFRCKGKVQTKGKMIIAGSGETGGADVMAQYFA